MEENWKGGPMKSILSDGLIRPDGLDLRGPRQLKVVSEPIYVKESLTGEKGLQVVFKEMNELEAQ